MTTTAPIIELDETTHRYSVDGIEYPSVTQILQWAGIADYSSIPEFIREYALARGQATHRAIHYLLEDDLDESSLDSDVAPRVSALKEFLFHSGFRRKQGMIEQRVFNAQYGFCGTFDAIGQLPALRGELALVDWKNADPKMSGTEYQTAAYLLCEPGIYNRAGIQLKGDGSYSVKTYSPISLWHDQRVFLQALADYKRSNGKNTD